MERRKEKCNCSTITNNNELHKNNNISEYDNDDGSKWSSEYMKIDKSIACVINMEREM